MAKKLQIEHLLGRKPAQLSGGQQQRVAMCRAIVKEPHILLLDEPMSNLDARLKIEIREVIKSIQQELKVTAIIVTHETSCIAEDKVKIEGMKTMKGKEALLFKAIDEQDETMVAMLLEMYGLSPLARNSDGLTALAYAESHVVQAGQEDYHASGMPFRL